MTTLKRPLAPSYTVEQFKAKLDAVNAALVAGAATGVDLKQLEESTRSKNGGRVDPVVDDFVSAAGALFSRRVQTYDGSTGVSWDTQRAETLDPAQVDAAKALVARAAKTLEGIDADRGVVDWNTAHRVAENPRAVFGTPKDQNEAVALGIAQSAVRATLAPHTLALIEWRDAVANFQGDVRSRQEVDAKLIQQASAHAKSDVGRDAVLWAYRERLVEESGRWRDLLPDAQRRELVEAETSFFSKLPFGKALFTKSPHLGDQELSRLLGTKDLPAFAEETKARVEAKVGDWAQYLKGQGRGDPVVA